MNLALKKVLVLLAVRVDSQHCWLHVYLNKPVNAHIFKYKSEKTRLVSLGVCTIYIPLIHYNALHTAAQ